VKKMAYLFLDTMVTEAALSAVVPPEALVPPSPDLTALEWSVVALARGDRRSTLREPGPFANAAAVLFGRRQNPRLADPRLEALRRVAVLLWHDGSLLPDAEFDALMAAGFTLAQFDRLTVHIARRSVGSPGGGRR
jgi:hypothetical protein